MENKAVIIDATRSPIGMKNGEMVGIRPDDLATQVVKGLMDRNEKINSDQVEDLVMGCAFPEGPQGMLICLLYTSPSPRDATLSRMPSSA